MKIGVISDTHGHLHPRVLTLFEGVSQILHAGDVGSRDVLVELEALAPVLAVHGNSDTHPLCTQLPLTASLETPAGLVVLVHYPPKSLPPFADLSPNAPPRVVVFGHTHFPKVLDDAGVMLLNPGSALRGRGAPPTVAVLTIDGETSPRVLFYCLDTGNLFPASSTHRHTHG